MPSSTPLSKVTISCTAVKIHESLFIWLGSLMLWHTIFSIYGKDIANVEYLQWGATALMVVMVSKWIISRNNCDFSSFVGSIDRSSLSEISLTTVLTILLGIGCWTILVLIEARVNLDWTYQWWGLLPPTDFEGIRWEKSWLFIHAISGVILVPITEEIIFRGFILQRMISKYDIWTAIWLSSFIFALFHVNKSFVGSLFHSVLYSILAIKFASLYAPMVAHGAYNLFAFCAQTCLGTFLAADKRKIGSMAYWAPELVCLLLGVAFFAVYIKKTRKSFAKNSG